MEEADATAKFSLREAMPITSGFVDAMREAFGRDEVDGWLLGRNGGAFWASENGHEWGTRQERGGQAMNAEAYLRLGRPMLPAAAAEDQAKGKDGARSSEARPRARFPKVAP